MTEGLTSGFCNSSNELLAMVDNYGLLCLDIAWAYFKLQDLQNLQEGSWRLERVCAGQDAAAHPKIVMLIFNRRHKNAWRRRMGATWNASSVSKVVLLR